ncbi:MAG: hypothetical protein EA379_06280 [Phycisphaerales bacterium]|nr:MAG: hypothetical protein EA379_06280 [Phycisphaerales bacterium]
MLFASSLPTMCIAAALLWPANAAWSQPQDENQEAQRQDDAREDAQEDGWMRRVWRPVRPEPMVEPSEPPEDRVAPDADRTRLNDPVRGIPGFPQADQIAPGDAEYVVFPAFAEPIELSSLIDWVSNRLQVNILSDPSIAGRMVKFNGPMRVRPDELLDLLSLLVEQQGFALTQEREGWYVIRSAGEIALNLAEGDFTTTRIIATPMLRPSALRPPIETALAGRTGAAGRISYVDELGIIIATDTPRGLRAVESVVDAIISEQLRQGLHRFEILHISADLARSKIIELNGGGAGAGRTTQARAQTGQQQTGGSPSASGGLSNLGDRLFIDAESNSIIFRGARDESVQVGVLLEVIDVPSRLVAKRYPAGPASPAITSYGERRGLGPTTSTQTGGAQMGSQQLGFRAPQRAGAGQTGESMSGSGFVLEDSLEAFVYFGTEAQHAQVQQLVDAFAEHARQARVVVEIYKLRHANAEDVADLLLNLVEDRTQDQFGVSPFLPQTGSARRPFTPPQPTAEGADAPPPVGNGDGESISFTPAEQVSITADISRNQVIIKAPARQQAEFKSIVEKLDVRRPQVYIEAKIVSVTTRDDFTFAVESQFTPGQSVLFTNFGLTTAGEGSDATDRRNVSTGLSGLTAAIIKNDYVPIVINALQRVGDTRIVSNPQLLVNDNEEAELISVREEPFSQTSQGGDTTITSQGGVAEAGTTLTITPRISDAGMLNLEYAVELSSFDGTSPGGGLQPPKQKENYRSIVTLPSDSTMVIGGLSMERSAQNVSKVPFLGDIPIIGELFRSTSRQTMQSTIYVFIRPVIMRDANFGDLRLITQGPMEISGIADDPPSLEPARIPVHAGSITGRPRPVAEPVITMIAADDDR